MASVGNIGKDPVLFHSVLEVQNQNYSVALTTNSIIWDSSHGPGINKSTNSEASAKAGPHVVDLREVIAVTPEVKPRARRLDRVQQTSPATSFTVFVIRRISHHRWRDRAVTFQCRDATSCQNWIERINAALANKDFNRPRKLLVYINPHSGKERGPKIYYNKVAPLFELAGITTDVIVTTHPNHARDSLLERDLSKVDGVISVGGDGMFSEILHGLLLRGRQDAGLLDNHTPQSRQISPQIRIGVIPAGSTDAVTFSTHGTGDAVTSALHIILGEDRGVDVFSVHNKSGFVRYGLSMIAYGFLGEVIRQSDAYRWLGPKRYDYLGVKEFLNGRDYAGEILYRGSSATPNSQPTDGAICLAGCGVCQEAEEAKQEVEQGVEGVPEPWKRYRGRFISFAAHCLSSRCEKSPMGPAPNAHVGDGCADLVLVQSCSKFNQLKYLIRVMDPNADHLDCEFVKALRAREFQFRPLVSYVPDEIELDSFTSDEGCQGGVDSPSLDLNDPNVSVWNCDGELLEEAAVHVKVHCQLIRLFSHGIEEENSDDDSQVSYRRRQRHISAPRWNTVLKQLADESLSLDSIATSDTPLTVAMETDVDLTDLDIEMLGRTFSREGFEEDWSEFMRLRPWMSKN